MKILHVTKKYSGALGGDAVVVSNLQKQQEAAGHSVIIVTSNCDEIKSASNVYKFGLKDAPARLDTITVRRLISLVMLFFKMFVILRKERPNIIHTHSVDMAFFVSFAAHAYHVPMVHTFHIVTFYDRTQSLLRRKSELWLAKKSRFYRVTAPNNYDVEKLRAAGLSQVVLLSNGVDLALWKTEGYVQKSGITTFVAIGRLEGQKGYEYLLRAVALLVDDAVPLRVTIVGEGSQKKMLHELARTLNVEEYVTFVGRKKARQTHSILAKAHIAVFPSLYETTPLTLLEAWAVGTPVISTSVGILRDISKDFDAAVVVPIADEQALATAMLRCMEDDALRMTIANAGYAEAKKYAWPRIGKMAESIYMDVL